MPVLRVLLTVLVCCLPLQALAQPTSAPSPEAETESAESSDAAAAETEAGSTPVFTLQTVTVSAAKAARSTDEVPEAVSVVEEQALTAGQSQSLDDTVRNLPNVDMAGGPRRVAERPVIRGLGGNRVLVTQDGVRQDFQSGHKGGYFPEPALMKRIEVVRGPASALYGSDALGGVVSVTTKDPSDLLEPGEDLGASLTGGYQSANAEQKWVPMLYGRLGENWEWLVSGVFRESDDIRQGGGDLISHSGEQSTYGLAKLVWYPDLLSTVRFQYASLGMVQEVPVNAESDDPTGAGLVDRITAQTTTQVMYGLADPGRPWLDLHVNVYQTDLLLTEDRQSDGRADEINLITTGMETRNTSRIGVGAGGWEQSLTYGVEVYEDRQTGVRNGGSLLVFPDATLSSTGVFVQDEVSLPGKLTLVPGLRYDEVTVSADDQDETNANAAVSPKLGAVVHVTPAWSLHALVAKGFRTPSIQELYISGLHFSGSPEGIFVPNADLRPEYGTNLETGFTWRNGDMKRDRAQRLRVTVFRNQLSNFIVTDVYYVPFESEDHGVECQAGGGCLFFRPDNVQRAELTGTEIEFTARAGQWRGSASFGATRGVDQDTGDALNSMPADKAVGELGYAWQEGLELAGRSTLVDAQDRVTDTSLATPGYTLFDAWVSWEPPSERFSGLRIDAGVDNLADESYRRHLQFINEAGRNIKLSATYRY